MLLIDRGTRLLLKALPQRNCGCHAMGFHTLLVAGNMYYYYKWERDKLM